MAIGAESIQKDSVSMKRILWRTVGKKEDEKKDSDALTLMEKGAQAVACIR